jgi:hypothetical protein
MCVYTEQKTDELNESGLGEKKKGSSLFQVGKINDEFICHCIA